MPEQDLSPAQQRRRLIIKIAALVSSSSLVACWIATVVGGLPWLVSGTMTAVAVVALGVWCVRRERAILGAVRSQLATQDRMEKARAHSLQVIRRIMASVEKRDRHWADHSANVGAVAAKIGRKLGLSELRCEQLVLAGELHDIGMLAIDDAMAWRKFGCDEFRRMTRHSELSRELLEPLIADETVLDAIRYHHERMNGTGYPDKLVGEAIPLEARILAVADAYDAMTHDRPQRRAMTDRQAMEELRHCSPAGYDEDCVAALLAALHMDVHDNVGPAKGGRLAV